jgi:hypothetical protein
MSRHCVLTHRPPATQRRYLPVTRGITTGVALALHLAGLYAGVATFGVMGAVGLYALGGITALLQYGVIRRFP